MTGRSSVLAEVPEVEFTRYAVELRSLAHGTGTFTRQYLRHAPAPDHVLERLTAGAGPRTERSCHVGETADLDGAPPPTRIRHRVSRSACDDAAAGMTHSPQCELRLSYDPCLLV